MTKPTLAFQPEAERYYAEGYWRDGRPVEDFDARAHEHPDRVALVLDDRAVTYDELRRAALGVSQPPRGRRRRSPGEVVILLGRHSIEAAVAMLGCLHRGVVLAPLPPMFNETQLSALSSRRRRAAIVRFGGEKEIAKCREVAGEVPLAAGGPAGGRRRSSRPGRCRTTASRAHADDLAIVLHSSGTTSAPKGIAHSSNTLRYATEGVCRRWGLTGDDIYLTVVEFGFVGGLVFGYLPVLLNGATGVLLNRWNAEEALRLIEEHRCTYVLAMPTHAADMIRAAERDRPRPLLDARARRPGPDAASGAWPCATAFGVPPLGDYGLSEVPGHAAHAPDDPTRRSCAPRAARTTARRSASSTTTSSRCPPARSARSSSTGRAASSASSTTTTLTRESLTDWGGYRTGDLGTLDEDGQFIYVGRSKDIIRRGGVTIVPAEVEPVILRHPAVHEVAIVPLPDDRLGERACAAIIPKPGHAAPTLAELQEFLDAEGVAKYTWPESVEVFDDFPRTPSLKVVKRDVATTILSRSQITA